MYQGKILLSDLDGTLLNAKREVSPENLAAIKHFVENGGRFGVATGRDIENVLQLLSHVPINFFCIFSNGSVLFDKDKKEILAERTLDPDKLIPFLEKCIKERPDIGLQIHTNQGTIFCPDESQVDPATCETHRPYTCKTLEELKSCTLRKILFITKDGDMSWLLENSEPFSDFVQRVQTSKVYFEFLPQNSSKGMMIREIRPFIKDSDIIYGVGDFYNDKEMMTESDIGIMCDNAPDELKPLAKFICANHNEHPIHDVIHRIIPLT